MEETRKRLEEFFDEMLRNMKYFKKKSYEQILRILMRSTGSW